MRTVQSTFLFVCLALMPSLVFAERPLTPPPSDQEALSRYTPVEIADYRETIRQVFILGDEMAGAADNPMTQKLIEQRMKVVERISDADLARLMSYGADFDQLYKSMASLRQLVHVPTEAKGRKAVALSSGFPDANYSFCGSVHGGAAVELAAQVTLDIAKGIWSAASRACDEVVVIAGEGGNTSLLCIIADTALAVGEADFNAVMFCENDIDSAEINGSYRRLDHIHTDVATVQSSVDSGVVAIINTDNANRDAIVANANSNKTAIINNDNTNRSLIINNDNSNREAIINNDLRLAIEQSLGANNVTPLAIFELPSPNGYIDLARSIVRQTIDNMTAAGQNVHQAESFYADAVALISSGRYKDAFHRLQQSYQDASK